LRCPVPVKRSRNILCIFPAYAPSFGTFAHAFALVPGVRAFMPPQGLLIVAAYLPERWRVGFIDENIKRAVHSDFVWADVVFVGGMHIQLSEVRDIQRRAKSCGKLTVLGGSAVSSSPETYPEFDYLHLGEIGDATDGWCQGKF
jgi:hopanoid C-2 methylase